MAQSLSALLDRIGQIPVLTAAQEYELARRIERGITDEQELTDRGMPPQEPTLDELEDAALARRTLVEHNIRLAVHVSRKFATKDVPLEDLVNEAVIGLHRAAEKFNWRKGYKFSTYATWWIRHMIQRTLYRDRTTIRVPGHIIARKRSIEKWLREHPDDNMMDAAIALDITPDQAEDAMDGARVVSSLDSPFSTDDSGDRYSAIADETSPDPAELASDPYPELSTALAELTPLERRVLELRFGFYDQPVRSRDECAEILGMKPHVVQRNQKSALTKLREELTPLQLEEVLS